MRSRAADGRAPYAFYDDEVRRFLDLVNDFNVRRRRSTLTAEREFTETRAQEALAQLRQVNLSGVIAGKSLYEKKFTVAEGQAALDGK